MEVALPPEDISGLDGIDFIYLILQSGANNFHVTKKQENSYVLKFEEFILQISILTMILQILTNSYFLNKK